MEKLVVKGKGKGGGCRNEESLGWIVKRRESNGNRQRGEARGYKSWREQKAW